jgi:hypothetical protein
VYSSITVTVYENWHMSLSLSDLYVLSVMSMTRVSTGLQNTNGLDYTLLLSCTWRCWNNVYHTLEETIDYPLATVTVVADEIG